MAPSQQEYYQQEQDINTFQYTHKKFNCGYSHKKLGLRLMRRNSQEELKLEQTQQQATISQDKQFMRRTTLSSNTLFRPYALDDESPRGRKTSFDNKTQVPVTTTHHHQNPQLYISHIPHHLYQTPQQSQQEYALKLQRQRAALYMKHVMQFYENGNGWPSVHPNAVNNPALYQQ